MKTVKSKRSQHKTKKNKHTDTCTHEIAYKSFETIDKKDLFSFEKKRKALVKLLNTPFSPNEVKPTTDFYSYINYQWLKQAENKQKALPKSEKYFVQVDDYRVTQNKVYLELFEIIKDYIKDNTSKKANCIRNVYLSLIELDSKAMNKHIEHLTTKLNYIYHYPKPAKEDELSSNEKEIQDQYMKTHVLLHESEDIKIHHYDDLLWVLLGNINRMDIISFACPINWKVLPDEKNSTIFRNYVSFPELSLYDLNLYLPDYGQTKEYIKYKKNVVKEYLKYINKIFDSCLGKNNDCNAQDVFDVEYDIFTSMGCNSIKNDSPDFYNIVKSDEALEKYGFDWKKFCYYLGYKKAPDTFICDSLNYLKCIVELLKKNFNTKKWRSYWYFIHLQQMIRFDKNRMHIYYDFNGKFIKGQPEPFPRELYPIFGLSYTFNSFLTDEYVSKYKNEDAVKFVEVLGYDLLTVFKRRIMRNTWLSPSTKKQALIKLNHLKLVVAQPKKMRDDPLLNYSRNDAWENMYTLSKWKTDAFLNLVGKEVVDIPVVDWKSFSLSGYQAYIVNAFYTPVLNSIYVPLAIIQKPFVDMGERGIEYELAHIGFVLGHEMSHSLDNRGSKYDYKGNLHDWWNADDKRHYNTIIKDIINQYETFASYDGITFDATMGVGEDMADISGISIVTEYLEDLQTKNEDLIPIRILSFKALYVYFAMQYREYIYKRALKAQILTNPHPLDKYRTNVPLSRLKSFRSIYNIKKGDKMWWHSTDTIW